MKDYKNYVEITNEWLKDKERKKEYKATTILPNLNETFNYRGKPYTNRESHNFMFDLTKSKMEYHDFIIGVYNIFSWDKTSFVEKVLIKKYGNFYIFKRI